MPLRLASQPTTVSLRSNDIKASSHRSAAASLRAWAEEQIRTLYPGCFALVMATGIISNAFFFEGYRAWSDVLFAVNVAAYPSLLALTLLRFLWFPRVLLRDLLDPRLVFSFF